MMFFYRILFGSKGELYASNFCRRFFCKIIIETIRALKEHIEDKEFTFKLDAH